MTTQKINESIVLAAIDGFESQKARIDQQIAELRAMLPGSNREAAAAPPTEGGTRKRTFSPDALRRMREAQKRRWERVRGESAPAASAPAAKAAKAPKKRRLSPEGRKAIQDALRKRWAAKKAAAKKGSPAKPAKKAAPSKRAATPATPPAGE
jgi:hypothetical protein